MFFFYNVTLIELLDFIDIKYVEKNKTALDIKAWNKQKQTDKQTNIYIYIYKYYIINKYFTETLRKQVKNGGTFRLVL